ncbi:MAG TPA: 1-deoxy-D-xylulose-5-phosphate reductoisomerase [Candidatus Dormibacteraeota bacterium]|nr:1-deoxy-D-xylulose-5-phosphate reductoisomerase [Candidatus Dormibacteraeota bacterium]
MKGPLQVVLLGCTGSIGVQALDLIDRFPDHFEVFGLVSGTRPAGRPAPHVIRAADDPDGSAVRALVTHPECDLVLVAISGAQALGPTLAALDAGKMVALASKEVLVMAGSLVMARALPNQLRPVDSEHSALWQCMWGESAESVSRLVLTASGGPFWGRPDLDLNRVSVAQALEHPRWSMGPKITIDSATMMNKGLELIEAHYLFGFPLERIEVVVHPESVVHSLVEFRDGGIKAQLSNPDMRLPIALALAYPERLPGVVPPTEVAGLGELHFALLDPIRFPAVELARRSVALGPPLPAVLNAANEEAVKRFLGGEIEFSKILVLVAEAVERFEGGGTTLAEILAADRWARDYVGKSLSVSSASGPGKGRNLLESG